MLTWAACPLSLITNWVPSLRSGSTRFQPIWVIWFFTSWLDNYLNIQCSYAEWKLLPEQWVRHEAFTTVRGGETDVNSEPVVSAVCTLKHGTVEQRYQGLNYLTEATIKCFRRFLIWLRNVSSLLRLNTRHVTTCLCPQYSYYWAQFGYMVQWLSDLMLRILSSLPLTFKETKSSKTKRYSFPHKYGKCCGAI